jgi:hypothetical protein
MSAPSFLDCRWERVVRFTRGLSIHPGKEPALSTGCIGGRISDVDVVTEIEKNVSAGVETREHTHTARYALLCLSCLSVHSHANIQIASLQTVAEVTRSI